MPFTRRTFLKLTVFFGAITGGVMLARYFNPDRRMAADSNDKITTFLDTLLPAFEGTPSASDLGITRLIMKKHRHNRRFQSMLTRAEPWLDTTAQQRFGEDFVDLNEAQRNDIVQLASQSPVRSLPFQLYSQLREESFRFYYSHPTVLTDLGSQIPQPLGFLDYNQPPS